MSQSQTRVRNRRLTLGTLEVEPFDARGGTMTMYMDGFDYFIEWKQRAFKRPLHIGLTFDNSVLADYRATSLPKPAIALIRQCGFLVPGEFER